MVMTEQTLQPAIQKEYARWLEKVGNDDPYVGKTTIGIHEVLEAHFLLVDFFAQIGEGIGGVGPKSLNLLHSALSRQFVEFGGTPKWNNRIEVCATLMFGLIKNHPFHDANKRTAFLVSMLHLQKIGRFPAIPQEEFEDFTVAIADNSLGRYQAYSDFDFRKTDQQVAAIAHFLKRGTREIDRHVKNITYQKLDGILHTFGLELKNPVHNRIDVMRFRHKDTGLTLARPYRIARIGFHAWSKQVSKKDIGIVREAAQLDVQHGYDSLAFFSGAADPLTLIRKYREPLRRLAYR